MSVITRSIEEVVAESSALTPGGDQSFDPSLSWTEWREMLLLRIRSEYAPESDQVLSYLRRNSDLAWRLLGAKEALEAEFGKGVEVRMALVADPDAEENREHLVAYIKPQGSIGDALVALGRFDNAWLLEKISDLDGRLMFDLLF